MININQLKEGYLYKIVKFYDDVGKEIKLSTFILPIYDKINLNVDKAEYSFKKNISILGKNESFMFLEKGKSINKKFPIKILKNNIVGWVFLFKKDEIILIS